jgi:hypothetical protein
VFAGIFGEFAMLIATLLRLVLYDRKLNQPKSTKRTLLPANVMASKQLL